MTDPTIFRTPNPNCGACLAHRWHYPGEWRTFHPFSTHGFTPETGWTHADLLPAGVQMRWPPAGSVVPQDSSVSRSTPSPKARVWHSADGVSALCGGSGSTLDTWISIDRLEVTCLKCLEILNR